MTLILASISPRRQELLPTLGLDFEIHPSDVDEASEEPNPVRRASLLALRKARAVAIIKRTDIIVAADTIVVLNGRPLGKPYDDEDAWTMLTSLRDSIHQVVTAVVVATHSHEDITDVVSTVKMRNYSDNEIAAYIARGEPFDKAGGYAIQDPEFTPAIALDSCLCAIIGLPLWTLRALLRTTAAIETLPPSLDRCTTCPLRDGD